MNENTKRTALFLAFAFGIAWATGLVIALTGGLVNSPVIFPALHLTLAGLLLATLYMWAPALANILTRLLTHEHASTWLRPYFRRGWPYWLIAWIAPAILVILGIVLFFVVQPQYYDTSLGVVRRALGQRAGTVNPWMFVASQLLTALLIAPVVNALATFGEEFGWRGYLLQRLMPAGWRKASLLLGIIWGIWHWPVIAMGYEYGFGYAGFPWLGFVAFWWFTIPAAIFLSWLTLRSRSVWPAVIGHGAINGIAPLGVLLVMGKPSPFIGPVPIGILGGLPFALVGLWLWLRPGYLPSTQENDSWSEDSS